MNEQPKEKIPSKEEVKKEKEVKYITQSGNVITLKATREALSKYNEENPENPVVKQVE